MRLVQGSVGHTVASIVLIGAMRRAFSALLNFRFRLGRMALNLLGFALPDGAGKALSELLRTRLPVFERFITALFPMTSTISISFAEDKRTGCRGVNGSRRRGKFTIEVRSKDIALIGYDTGESGDIMPSDGLRACMLSLTVPKTLGMNRDFGWKQNSIESWEMMEARGDEGGLSRARARRTGKCSVASDLDLVGSGLRGRNDINGPPSLLSSAYL